MAQLFERGFNESLGFRGREIGWCGGPGGGGGASECRLSAYFQGIGFIALWGWFGASIVSAFPKVAGVDGSGSCGIEAGVQISGRI